MLCMSSVVAEADMAFALFDFCFQRESRHRKFTRHVV